MADGLIWHGVPEFKAALDKAVADAYKAGQRGANNAAALVDKTTKAKLAQTTHKRGTPTPSAPGEPPSLVSGQLRRSVLIVPATPRGATAWVAKVGPTAVYARIQELGGSAGTTVLPARPYLEPAVRELIDSGALWAAFRSGYASF
jgi:hypothetical protein